MTYLKGNFIKLYAKLSSVPFYFAVDTIGRKIKKISNIIFCL